MRKLLLGLLIASAPTIASSEGEPEIPDSSKFEWPVANDVAAYGIRLRMPYREARQRMIKHGWTPDSTEANARHTAAHLPYPEFPEVTCGEGRDAICSGWFTKGQESRLLDIRNVKKILVVRGSSE
jgi:hypothetical protein